MLFFNDSPLFQLDFDVVIVIFIYCYSIYFKFKLYVRNYVIRYLQCIMFPQDI